MRVAVDMFPIYTPSQILYAVEKYKISYIKFMEVLDIPQWNYYVKELGSIPHGENPYIDHLNSFTTVGYVTDAFVDMVDAKAFLNWEFDSEGDEVLMLFIILED